MTLDEKFFGKFLIKLIDTQSRVILFTLFHIWTFCLLRAIFNRSFLSNRHRNFVFNRVLFQHRWTQRRNTLIHQHNSSRWYFLNCRLYHNRIISFYKTTETVLNGFGTFSWNFIRVKLFLAETFELNFSLVF